MTRAFRIGTSWLFHAVMLCVCCCPGALFAQSSIAITSPASGTVEYRGATFTLSFTADPSVSNLAVIGEFNGSWSETQSSTGTFSVAIPATTPVRQYQLYVIGTVNGAIVTSAPITIAVDSSVAISTLQIQPGSLLFSKVGDVGHLIVSGNLSDGTTSFLNESSQITFASGNPAVASVDKMGTVAAIAPGKTVVTVTGPNGLQASVPTVVPSLPVSAPIFAPTPGTFFTPQQVTISDAASGAVIYYTTDGSLPTPKSALYRGPLTISSTTTLNALGVVPTGGRSVAWGTYTIAAQPATAFPTFSPAAGTFTAAQSVTISDATTGASIYYTTDGSTPTSSSTLYSGPITVSSTETIQAIAEASGYTNSAVASATYTINLPQDFTIGLSATTLTVTAGQSGTLTATVGTINGFSQPVSFTCSGLPSGDTCSFSPSTVTGSGTTTVTVATAVSTGLVTGERPFELAGLLAGLSLWLAGRRFRRLGRIEILMMLAIGIGGTISACGGSGGSKTSTAPTTSTVTINAASGSLTHTASFALTVK